MAASKKTKFMKKEISKLVEKGPSKGALKGQKFTQKRAVAAAINVGKKKGFKFSKKSADESTDSMFDALLAEKELDTKAREHIKPDNFVFPDKAPGHGSYPIHDLAHAKNALSRASAQGESVFKAVSAKVYAKYPGLKERHDKREESMFDGFVESTGGRVSLFDEILTKDVDESDDTRVEKMARTLALTESLVEIRNSLAQQ
jgi:hypothetical protein